MAQDETLGDSGLVLGYLYLGDVLVLLVQGHVGLRGVAEVGHRLRRCGDVVAAVGLDSGHGKDSGTKG